MQISRARIVLASLALTLALFCVAGLQAQEQTPAPTYVVVPGLHCGGCAKKVTPHLAKVPGIGKIGFDLKTKTFRLVPRPGAVLSPRAVWEAIEKAKQKPTKLKGPSGTFDAKPRS